MDVKTYQAYSMAEALAAVKHDLGHDALILHTRCFRRGGMLGLGRRTVVEVTATPGGSRAIESAGPAAAGLAAARRAYMVPQDVDKQSVSTAPVLSKRSSTGMADDGFAKQLGHSELSPATRERAPESDEPPQATRRFILHPANGPGTAGPFPDPASRRADDAMQRELSAIRHMVSQALQRPAAPPRRAAPEMPPRVFDIYLQLIGQDLFDELAESVAGELAAADGDAIDDAALRDMAVARLATMIETADPPLAAASPDARPLTVALVGPTGVGKTTTLAKLAASLHLKEGRRVGLVTADTYRIAAVDQLKTYAGIIGLPLQVALTQADMRQSIQALCDCDVVLIDTAGRSQNDPQRLEELRHFLGAAQPHEVHLVLSAGAGERVLRQQAEAFALTRPQRIILSKLDEAAAFGGVINAVRAIAKPISFFTTGQEVPDDIEPASARRLAELLLGESLVHA